MKSCSQIPCGCGSGCRRAKVHCQLEVWNDMWHVFKCFRFGKRRWPWKYWQFPAGTVIWSQIKRQALRMGLSLFI